MLQEIGTIQDIKPTFNSSELDNTVETDLDIDGNKLWLQLSTNPSLVADKLDKIYGTKFQNQLDDYIINHNNIKGFPQTLPSKYNKVGSIDMRINDESGTIKSRKEKNVDPKIEYDQLVADNQDIITQAKRLGLRDFRYTMMRGDKYSPLYNFLSKNRQLFTKLSSLEQKIKNYKETEEETPDTKLYIKALNTTFNIVKKFIEKTNPNIFIINYPSELPDEITSKRNNIYKQYAQKYLTQGYNIKEKNGILYLENNNLDTMNEIKRMQQLAGIITEIRVNNPNKIDVEYYSEEDGGENLEGVYFSDPNKPGIQWEAIIEGDDVMFNTSWFDDESGFDDMYEVEKYLTDIFNNKRIKSRVTDDREFVVIPKSSINIINK